MTIKLKSVRKRRIRQWLNTGSCPGRKHREPTHIALLHTGTRSTTRGAGTGSRLSLTGTFGLSHRGFKLQSITRLLSNENPSDRIGRMSLWPVVHSVMLLS